MPGHAPPPRGFTSSALLLLLAAACSDGGPSAPQQVPEDPPVGSVSAIVGPEGAEYAFYAHGGVRVTVTVPPGAVESPQEIAITPEAPSANGWLDLTFEPEGLIFRQPVTVVLTVPDEVDATTQVLFWGDPSDPMIIRTVVNESARTLTTHARTFGLPAAELVVPGPSSRAPLGTGPWPTSHGSGGTSTMGALTMSCDQVVARARAEFNAFVARKDYVAAMRAANAASETLELAACPAESDELLGLVADAGCLEMEVIQQAAIDAPITDYGDFDSQVRPAVQWQGVLQLAGAGEACRAELNLADFVRGQVDDFVAFVSLQLIGFTAYQWDTFQDLRLEVARAWHLWADAQSLGVGGADQIRERAIFPLGDRIRDIAYGLAKVDGWHYPLSRLTATGWLGGRDIVGITPPRPCDDYFTPPRCSVVSQVVRFTDQDIFRDLQYAGTDVAISSRTDAAAVVGTDRAGGNGPGDWDAAPVVSTFTRGTIQLSGDLWAFTCWADVEADHEVTLSLDGTDVLTLPRPAGGSDYLDPTPEIDVAEVATLLTTPPAEGKTGKLVARRTRTDCDERLWGPEEFELFTADLVWKNPTLDVQVTVPPQVAPGASVPVDVRVAIVDPFGASAYYEGIEVDLSASAGTLGSGSGTTDAQGWFQTTLAMPAAAAVSGVEGTPARTSHVSAVTIDATATSYEGVTQSAQATASLGDPGRTVLNIVSHQGRAHIRAFGGDRDELNGSTAPGTWNYDASVSFDTTTIAGSIGATAQIGAVSTVSTSGDAVTSVTGSISGSMTWTASGETTGFADANAETGVQFDVVDGAVPFTLSATGNTSGTWLTFVQLSGAGGTFGFYAESPTVPPASLEESGVLAPGSYWFTVYWGNDQQSCLDCSIQAQGSVTYTLTLGGS